MKIQKRAKNYMAPLLLTVVSFLTLIGCTSKTNTPKAEPSQTAKSLNPLLQKTINHHGAMAYKDHAFKFTFRDNVYSIENKESRFKYTKKQVKGDTIILDTLTNDGFVRYINDTRQELSAKELDIYSNALNSVAYFVLLPGKLDDPAVNIEERPAITLGETSYTCLKITFSEENGGKDFDDIFYYWFDEASGALSFLAYEYHVNKGGIRFRKAQNARKVDGILVQDYINYKATVGTPLDSLPLLWEMGKLEELSIIENKNLQKI